MQVSCKLIIFHWQELKELPRDYFGSQSSNAGNKHNYPPFDMHHIVLKKANALLLKYKEFEEYIPSMLTQTNDRKTFEEINVELDMISPQFHSKDLNLATS